MKSAVFILTHGRPNKQLTLDLLNRIGYTGQVWLVLDTTDNCVPQYIDKYGADRIRVFNKEHWVEKTDTGNNNPVLGCGVYARNAIEDMAKSMDLDVHIQADDDIKNIRYRYIDNGVIKSKQIEDGNALLQAYMDAVVEMNIAGIGFGYQIQYRKGCDFFNSSFDCLDFPYNFIVRNNKIPVDWSMNFCDDYATQALLRNRGVYTIQTPFVSIDNSEMYVTDGGMADSYAQQTELSKLMYIKMPCPNQISLRYDGEKLKSTKYRKNCSPKILSEVYKK